MEVKQQIANYASMLMLKLQEAFAKQESTKKPSVQVDNICITVNPPESKVRTSSFFYIDSLEGVDNV